MKNTAAPQYAPSFVQSRTPQKAHGLFSRAGQVPCSPHHIQSMSPASRSLAHRTSRVFQQRALRQSRPPISVCDDASGLLASTITGGQQEAVRAGSKGPSSSGMNGELADPDDAIGPVRCESGTCPVRVIIASASSVRSFVLDYVLVRRTLQISTPG